MKPRAPKFKLGKTKPMSQLFMFSNKLSKNVDNYFSGNVVIEIELKKYDYKHHDEAEKVVEFMKIFCNSNAIEPYKYMTVVANYKKTGTTLASLSGEYEYMIGVNGKDGYDRLDVISTALNQYLARMENYDSYEAMTLGYLRTATKSPLNISTRHVNAVKNQLKKTKQSIEKSFADLISKFEKNFVVKY